MSLKKPSDGREPLRSRTKLRTKLRAKLHSSTFSLVHWRQRRDRRNMCMLISAVGFLDPVFQLCREAFASVRPSARLSVSNLRVYGKQFWVLLFSFNLDMQQNPKIAYFGELDICLPHSRLPWRIRSQYCNVRAYDTLQDGMKFAFHSILNYLSTAEL